MLERRLVGLSAVLAAAALAAPAAASAYTSAMTADGDTVMFRDFSSYSVAESSPPAEVGLARVKGDLQPETAFGRNGFTLDRLDGSGFTYNGAAGVAIDPQGRIVLAYMSDGSPAELRLRRYLDDGRKDPAFAAADSPVPGLDPSFQATDLVAQATGRLVAAGMLADPARPGTSTPALVGLQPDGSLDTSFGDDGIARAPLGPTPSATRVVARNVGDGRIVLRGTGLVAVFGADGDLDPSFGGDGVVDAPGAGPVAPAGTGFLVATEVPNFGGIAIDRLTADGSPDPAWGTGGRSTLPLDAQDESVDPDTGEHWGPTVRYFADDVLALPGGGAVVGATRHEEDFDRHFGCPIQDDAAALVLDASGRLVRQLDGYGESANHLMLRPDGKLIIASDATPHNCDNPLYSYDITTVALYDSAFDRVGARDVRPVLAPPSVTIAEGPPAVDTGPESRFRFVVTPGPRDGTPADVALECSIDSAPAAPCNANAVFRLANGPHHLVVRALGINGAPSDPQSYDWTVNRPPETAPNIESQPPTDNQVLTPASLLDTSAPRVKLFRLARPTLVQALRHGFKTRFTSTEAGVATITLWHFDRTTHATSARAKRVVVARGSRSVPAGGRRTLVARFTRRAKHQYRHAQRIRLRLQVVVVDRAGNRTVKQQHLTLKR